MKKFPVLAGLALSLSLSAVAVTPAQAEPKNEEILIAQLRGRDLVDPIEIYSDEWLKFRFEDFVIGRVRGRAGEIIHVQLLAPESVTINDKEVTRVNLSGAPYYIHEGDDVILKYVDGEWVFLSDDIEAYQTLYSNAMPAWVSRLELKEEVDVERTAIDFDDPEPVALPAQQPTTVYEPPAAPVRGLW